MNKEYPKRRCITGHGLREVAAAEPDWPDLELFKAVMSNPPNPLALLVGSFIGYGWSCGVNWARFSRPRTFSRPATRPTIFS